MRVIVTEKGQEFRKEFFFDNINEQNTMAEEQFHQSFVAKQGSA